MSDSQNMSSVSMQSKLALEVDSRGLTVYGNSVSLRRIATRLNELASADPEACWEVHLRDFFESETLKGSENSVSLVVDGEIADFFTRLPDDAPLDAKSRGFELTFMHVTDSNLNSFSKK